MSDFYGHTLILTKEIIRNYYISRYILKIIIIYNNYQAVILD